MRSLTPVAVYVVAILTFHSRSYAQLNPVAPEDTSTVSSTATSQYHGVNGYDQFRQYPDPGCPGSPAYGFKHFPSPTPSYTTWHRPKSSTWTRGVRCVPQKFRPRGFGNLFARPCDPFRMEYTPYSVTENASKYGPSYILNQPDQRCQDCGH
ncbi:MAG: hypothetical protein P8J37_08660 [Fuerstiella sp.]|nr:hypothetical protein [Fuerstiella sp.]